MEINTYISYITRSKASAVALAMEYEEESRYVQGSYRMDHEEGDRYVKSIRRASSIGCMTGGENVYLMGEFFGFDQRIGHVMGRIFDGLPNGEHKTFTAKVFKAMPEGVDTTKVYAHFMAKVLRRAAKHDKTGNCEVVAKLHDLLVGGVYVKKDWDAAEAAAVAARTAGFAGVAVVTAWNAVVAVRDAWRAWDTAQTAAEVALRAAWAAGGAWRAAWNAAWAAWAARGAEYQQQAQDLIDSCEHFGCAK